MRRSSGSGVATAIAAGVVSDAVLGDQPRFHPVAGFGRVAATLERQLWRPQRPTGIVYALTLVVAVLAATTCLERRLSRSRRALFMFRAAAVWSALGGRSLSREALALAELLEQRELEEARRRVPALVGRDPSGLEEGELARAAVESVAENTVDAIVAPLLWASVGGAPAVLAYRAVNTLDAMIGHKNERYERFGWAAARLDDVVSWPAARVCALLAVLAAPVVGGSPREAWRVLRRDGRRHPSPNAGPSEAAFAGALGLRLGGANRYGERLEHRPQLGDGRQPRVEDISRAVNLLAVCSALAALIAVALASAVER
jgi:adenosylcobinamide-phosphate synthase